MKWMRAALIVLLIVAAGGLILFGPRAGNAPPAGLVVVEYWEKWTNKEEAEMRQIVDWYNETVGREKGIFVRYLSTSSINQKTLIATAAGVPPDIAGIGDSSLAQFAALDALEPLDELAAAYGITAEKYKRVFWDECHYDGKLYGLVSTPYDVALHFNTKHFADKADSLRAAGLDPTRAPRTIRELDAYAAVLDTINAGGGIEIAGYLPLEPGWFSMWTCFWFGGSWWDESSKRFTFTDPAVVRSFEWIQSYYKRLGKTAISDFRSGAGTFDSPQNPFMSGTVSMVKQGTYLASFIHNNRPLMDGHWSAEAFPTDDPNLRDVTYCTTDVLVIPRGAKRKKEAFDFIAFVNQQDVNEKLNSMHCKISPLASVSEGYLSKHQNPHIRVFERLAASPNAHGTPPVPILPQVLEELGNFTQKLSLMQVTPAEELPLIQARLQQKYDLFMQRQKERKAATRREVGTQ